MSLKIDRVQLEIVINNDESRKKLRELEDEARQLKRDMKKLTKGTEEYAAKEAELKKVQVRMDKIIDKIGLTGLSLKELTQRQRELNMVMRNMDPRLPEYKKLESQLQQVSGRIKQLRMGAKKTKFSMGNLADGFNRYTTMFAAGAAAITGVVFGIKQWVDGMVTLDDAMADVMKTTGMAKGEVRDLYKEFKNLNTRTPRRELLALAEEAGRLGKKSKQDVMDFVDVANQIKTALGDDLGGDAETAIREVGKLTNIYKVGAQYGTSFKDSMLKIGSAINEVSANSSAQADYQIGYLKRMGGIADQAEVNASQIIGYASALDQLGQRQEMAATAQGKVMIDMFTDQAKYAEIAGMKVNDFTTLLKEDANEAFLKFLEGLNGNNEGLTVMATKLDDLGIDGSRATQVLATLAANTSLVRKEQALASKAMKEGISLTNEYRIKNENFAGSVAKIGQFIHSKLINTTFLGWLEKVTVKMAEWVKASPVKALKEQIKNVNLLTIEMTSANTPAKRRNEIYNELKGIAPDVVKNIDLENISVSTLRKNLERYNMAMIKKLALKDSELVLEEEREKAGEAAGKRAEKEVQAVDLMYENIVERKRRLNQDATKEKEIILSQIDVVEKLQKLEALDSDGSNRLNYKYVIEEITKARQEEKEATEEVSKAMEDYMKRYELLFGAEKEGDDGKGGKKNPIAPDLIELPELSDKEKKKNDEKEDKVFDAEIDSEVALWFKAQEEIDKLLLSKPEQHEKVYEEMLGKLICYKDTELITEEQFNAAKEALDNDFFMRKEERDLSIRELELEKKLLDSDNDLNEYEARVAIEEERFQLDFERANGNKKLELEAEKKHQASLAKIGDKALEKDTKRIRKEEKIKLQRIDTAQKVFSIMSTLVNKESALGKAVFVAMKILEAAKIVVKTQADNALILSANLAAYALLGPGAPAAAALASAAPIAANNLSAGLSIGMIAAQTVSGLEAGGYSDVVRAQDGKRFRAKQTRKRGFLDKPSILVSEGKPEFVANGDAVENPTVRPVLDVIDAAQRAGVVHSLDLPAIVRSMPSMRGLEFGGYAQQPAQSQIVPEYADVSEPNADLLNLIQRNTIVIEEFNDLIKKGINAKVIYGDIEDKMNEVETIRNSANL